MEDVSNFILSTYKGAQIGLNLTQNIVNDMNRTKKIV